MSLADELGVDQAFVGADEWARSVEAEKQRRRARVSLGSRRRRADGSVEAAMHVHAGDHTPALSLTAAAQILSGKKIARDRDGHAKRATKDVGAWQSEAWALLDEVGELWFAGSWVAAALSRVRIVAAKVADNGDEPQIIDVDLECMQTPDDPCFDDQDEMVAEYVSRWAGGPAGQEAFLARAGWQLGIAGDSYFVATDEDGNSRGDRAGDETWMAYSNEEIGHQATARDGGTWTVEDGGATGRHELPPDALVIRCWRPHPRKYREAASAVRAALPILRELRGLTQHVSAQIDSRLAGAGLLLLPQSMTFPSGGQNADANDGEDPFVAALMEAMLTPIKDRDSAAAVVPIVVKVPDESLGKAQHLKFDSPLDITAKSLREEAIHRLSLALDIPAEIITGMSGANHWSAWQIDESAIKLHVAPIAAAICHALTVGWLQPLLEELEVDDPEQYLVWFDTTNLVLRPDRSGDAKELYDRAAIGAKALRREAGFSETDAPSEEERREQLLIRIVERAPTLAPLVLPYLGIDITDEQLEKGRETILNLGGMDPAALEAGGDQPPPLQDPIRDARQITSSERQEIADSAQRRGRPDPAESEAGMAAAALPAGDGPHVSGTGCTLDLGMVEACNMAVLRALEHAGKRMVFGSRKHQAELRQVQAEQPYRMHMHVGVTERDLDQLLTGAWTCVEAGRPDDAHALVPVLDHYVRLLLQHRIEHDKEYLRAALTQAGLCTEAVGG